MNRSPERHRARLRLACALVVLCAAGEAAATMYKCQMPDGRTEYSDRPCKGSPNAPEWRPKQPLNVVSSETLTGRPKPIKDNRPEWLKGPDPIGDCQRRGGTFDPEFRACRLP